MVCKLILVGYLWSAAESKFYQDCYYNCGVIIRAEAGISCPLELMEA